MFQRLRSREDPHANIRRLYGVIVAQARSPGFYMNYGVPDTVEGRFDMVVLHVYLVFRRLAAAGEESRAIGQDLFDLFIEDMDASMRELGVSDISVPRKMRAMAEGYYGRTRAYDAALAEDDDNKLIAALARNVFAGAENKEGARLLARYVRESEKLLTGVSAREVENGAPAFADLEVRA